MHPEGIAAPAPWPWPLRPRPRPGRPFTVTVRNNGAVGAAINMLVAVQGLSIIAASVRLRLRRPRAAGAPQPARSGSEEARPGHEQHEHRDLRRRCQPTSPARPESDSARLSRSVTAGQCDFARPAAVRHAVLKLSLRGQNFTGAVTRTRTSTTRAQLICGERASLDAAEQDAGAVSGFRGPSQAASGTDAVIHRGRRRTGSWPGGARGIPAQSGDARHRERHERRRSGRSRPCS